ncbi:Na+/H+ antiporter subunit E [Desulfuribacillus alkaliarsenatis]|uniref:Cation:proton antiporter n=1 Tax=Desulfuribacillus alkaliarsenatis TaxID=766136 RepID=A0A1E5G0P6_9FIRM|nr:Na+/H+ antiporter subunit E [Desulfuribacillus alkaliarsenatis]OEF96323.1 cation:proton antiporter [Desulfuribacillus alkaliarsenatis]
MAFQIVLNIVLAVIWMLLVQSYTFVDFVIGYFIGVLLLWFLQRFLSAKFYFHRVIAMLKLFLLFCRELTLSNIDIARTVLIPRLDICPGIVAFPTRLRCDWQITLLAALISLTPGTLSMAFSDDGRTIYIHSIHVPDKDEKIREIKETFEKAIMEVTH